MSELHAGSRFLEVNDDRTQRKYRTWVVYPTRVTPSAVRFGPYTVDVSADATLDVERRARLVVVSHGSGSSPFLFRTLAIHLAKAGFVVALVEHPGNNRLDDALANSDENLVNRPRHLRLAIDAVARDASFGPRVDTARVALIGQSLGAYTALAAAGGKPCSRAGQPLEIESDPRVASLVLLTPAAFWFVPDGSLHNVTAPILVYAAEEDTITPPWHAHLVQWTVPDRSQVTVRLVPHAGHLSLLSELPAAAGWRDPPGFDRAAVHAMLGDEIAAFVDRTMPEMSSSSA